MRDFAGRGGAGAGRDGTALRTSAPAATRRRRVKVACCNCTNAEHQLQFLSILGGRPGHSRARCQNNMLTARACILSLPSLLPLPNSENYNLL